MNESAASPQVDLLLDYASRIHVSFQQNAIPVIRRLEIRNNSDTDLREGVCRFRATPEWAHSFTLRLPLIPAQTDYAVTDLPLNLDAGCLASLSERVGGNLLVELLVEEGGDREERILVQKELPIDVFAQDEWPGLASLPELLAAFVTPDGAGVEELLGRAAELLGERGGSSSLDGYRLKSKRRVYEMLDGIFAAVREQGIGYRDPPAGFETTGQRIRFGGEILRSRQATCLDLCLLFAAVIEQAGLRPLILVEEGHAYLGCWLLEETLPEPNTDDLQAIRKRVELEEILLFEPTLACDGQDAGFDAAVSAARKHLGHDAIFREAIDIYCARLAGIRPLSLNRTEEEVDLETAGERPSPVEPPAFRPEVEPLVAPVEPASRIDHWRQQLLDLTLRNRLLNFRETKQTIPLLCPDPEHLEDELAAAGRFRVLEQSKQMAGADAGNLALQERPADDPLIIYLTGELKAKRLRSYLTDTELDRRLVDLYRRARLEMEESGANTLYLALGFLEWKEAKASDRLHRAPILLIPVRLERQSVQQGFLLRRHDEDAMINVTLLELLRRDFEMEIPGVNPPPEGESGVDVGRVFRLFQQAVREMTGWEVRREVWLAQFSFNKFLLWKDLTDRAEQLTDNPIVDHLVYKPGQPFFDEGEPVREEELDDRLRCDEVFCPVSADSSQLAAIVAAANGRNFVMHGPPGTGKSQTITNLISHCLALGKRVLFVAEKRAALEVVHRRLSQIGLGPFCLELHSNKTGKTDVLRQFGEALDFADRRPPEEWEHFAGRLEAARAELNEYVRELHRRYPNGLSARQCFSWMVAHGGDPRVPAAVGPLHITGIEEQSRENLEELQQLCEDLQVRGTDSRLPPEAKAALSPVGAAWWTPEWEDAGIAAAGAVEEKCDALGHALRAVEEGFCAAPADPSREQLEDFVELCTNLVDTPALPPAFLEAGDWQGFREQAGTWIAAGRRRDAARAALDGFDLEAVLAFDAAALEERYDRVAEKGGFVASLHGWFLLRPVRASRLKGSPRWSGDQAGEFFAAAMQLQSAQRILTAAHAPAVERLGKIWPAGMAVSDPTVPADWEAAEAVLQRGDRLHGLLERLAGEQVERLLELRRATGRLVAVGPEMLAGGKPLAAKIVVFGEKWRELCAAETTFRDHFQVGVGRALEGRGHLGQLLILAGAVNRFRRELQNWCRWQEVLQRAQKAQLGPLLAAVEEGLLPLEHLRAAFENRYREQFLRRLLTLSRPLRDFWGDEHQKRIEAFHELDRSYTRLTAGVVAARLAAELPRARHDDCPRNTELGILQRERVKKARHKPVRRLLREISTIAPKLKPCFLMSPLSVAQYLDVDQGNFDLVVFDEASQIPVWDAVGAIARGRQVVIVGDPKQLPPTNFFGRVESDEEAIDDGSITDLESILDECLGSGLGTYYLRWHYRSRREGLIAFSNHHYYDNKLHTFPSPDTGNVGIRLVPVPEGHYDKGRSRTNKAEAEAIKADVVRRLTDPHLARQSLGIVTFSQAQQTLVMDKLDEARREHPEIEEFFNDEAPEPVFVKNLENVQGDERDVILFSVCYGPDREGRLSMNFGPLNRSGGERRLNVAVTRAKQEIVVFSTLRSDQIDLARTRATGAEHLKAYLEYAERGPRALAAGAAAAAEESELFESEVAAFLRGQGYEVHTRIGCSGYRIDMAVVSPEAPGRYLLGIEGDGPVYRRAATARDRDCLRESVLAGLGWRIHRIWTTDWWRDRENAEQRLLVEVERAAELLGKSCPPEAGPGHAAAKGPEPLPPAEIETVSGKGDDRKAADAGPKSRQLPYPAVKIQRQPSPEAFYQPAGRRVIEKQMRRVIETEGPITEGLLLRRVAEEWQFSRAGPRIREILASCLPAELAESGFDGAVVYWPGGLSPCSYPHYRVPTEDPASRRKPEEIPGEELANALLDILERYVSYPKEDLLREVARTFGMARVTPGSSARLEPAFDRLLAGGAVVVDGDVVKLPQAGARENSGKR